MSKVSPTATLALISAGTAAVLALWWHSTRAIVGPGVAIVTPSIRPAGTEAGDQKRVAAPAEAIRAGADYLVVGRPITGASDPKAAADAIVAEIAAAVR